MRGPRATASPAWLGLAVTATGVLVGLVRDGVAVRAEHQRDTEKKEKSLAVIVERRDIDTVVVHGVLAGLLAGLLLGVSAIVASLVLQGSALLPFRFASAFVVGPAAFGNDVPALTAILLGLAIHFTLSAIFGTVFVGGLSLTYQLSARAWLLIIYGTVFGFGVWEINFLAAVPALFPFLAGRLDLSTQVWNGIISYVLIYGPLLGLYVARVRPGVVDDWHAVGPPADTFDVPGETRTSARQD